MKKRRFVSRVRVAVTAAATGLGLGARPDPVDASVRVELRATIERWRGRELTCWHAVVELGLIASRAPASSRPELLGAWSTLDRVCHEVIAQGLEDDQLRRHPALRVALARFERALGEPVRR